MGTSGMPNFRPSPFLIHFQPCGDKMFLQKFLNLSEVSLLASQIEFGNWLEEFVQINNFINMKIHTYPRMFFYYWSISKFQT
jgi:hypothetical protein